MLMMLLPSLPSQCLHMRLALVAFLCTCDHLCVALLHHYFNMLYIYINGRRSQSIFGLFEMPLLFMLPYDTELLIISFHLISCRIIHTCTVSAHCVHGNMIYTHCAASIALNTIKLTQICNHSKLVLLMWGSHCYNVPFLFLFSFIFSVWLKRILDKLTLEFSSRIDWHQKW